MFQVTVCPQSLFAKLLSKSTCPFWEVFLCLTKLCGIVLRSFQVAGTSGKALLEGGSDDEGSSTEAHGRAIIEVLGKEKRNEILAALYMVRTDVSLSVRQVGITSYSGWQYLVYLCSGQEHPETESYILPGCFTRLENYCCQHSKDS